MAEVLLKNMSKVYKGGIKAVEKVNIEIKDKEFVVLVGPSGCGKSTTLRMIAGLEDITDGDFFIDSKRMNDQAPKDRDIAMVFQNYALYPHMSVYNNMAFGLRIRKFSKSEIENRVREAAQILDIEELLERKPKALSGGQRQRVAVGRAIVRKPKVFLFDEPLSNLDAKLRVQMRAEISSLHTRLKATMIYVTHDQVEAMTMGDKIVVMKSGLIQQIGSPLEIYNNPINRFVASFIGSPPMNITSATLTQEGSQLLAKGKGLHLAVDPKNRELLSSRIGKELILGIRPEDLELTQNPKKNNLEAKILVVEPLGYETHLYVEIGDSQFIVRAKAESQFQVGDTVNFTPRLEKTHFFDPETECSLLYKNQKKEGPDC